VTSPSYLWRIQYDKIDTFADSDKVTLHHTESRSLFNAIQRIKFIDDFIVLVLFLAEEWGNVEFVRCPDDPIHRDYRKDDESEAIEIGTDPFQ